MSCVWIVLIQSWGSSPDAMLAEIDPIGLAGSLGQVHRAVTRDGRQMAIKVRYPGIREAVSTDLKFLGWLSTPVGNLHRGFDLSAYQAAVLHDLDRELDYRQEADWHDRFSPWPLLVKLGYQRDLLEPLAAKLPALCRLLFEPFCAEYPFDLGQWNLSARIADMLGDDRTNNSASKTHPWRARQVTCDDRR